MAHGPPSHVGHTLVVVTDVRPVGIPSDTSIEAWKMEMAAVRRMTPEQRNRLWAEFQEQMASTERDAINRKYPDLDDRTAIALLVRRRHGPELASAIFPDVDFTDLR